MKKGTVKMDVFKSKLESLRNKHFCQTSTNTPLDNRDLSKKLSGRNKSESARKETETFIRDN